MTQSKCRKCGIATDNWVEVFAYDQWTICKECELLFYDVIESFFQPERSKREDCKLNLNEPLCNGNFEHCCPTWGEIIKEMQMRCSEHCGNTVRDK